MENFTRESVEGAGCLLSVVTLGDADAPPMVMLHGMRDHALSMLFMSGELEGYRLIAPDLRGHGDSENTGMYSMLQFVADMKAVFEHFHIEQAPLIGHSLGGHICARFTSLYPEHVSRLVLLDGLGPPGAEDAAKPESVQWRMEQWKSAIAWQLSGESGQRVMPHQEYAVERLGGNNPKLSAEQVRFLVEHGVEEVEGGVRWKWDPRVDMIWTTFSHIENEAAFAGIPCPVLLVTGDRGLDYWTQRRADLKGQHAFYESEQERRVKLFPKGERIVVDDAGHMLHYDQPQLLGREIRRFLGPERKP